MSPRTFTDPGYLKELKSAGMFKRDLEDALEKRQHCRHDELRQYVNTEHVDVGRDFADAQRAEIFMHHRVLIVPVADDGRMVGVITRADFFRSVAERFLLQ
jgi:predicted transcriptional regulator